MTSVNLSLLSNGSESQIQLALFSVDLLASAWLGEFDSPLFLHDLLLGLELGLGGGNSSPSLLDVSDQSESSFLGLGSNLESSLLSLDSELIGSLLGELLDLLGANSDLDLDVSKFLLQGVGLDLNLPEIGLSLEVSSPVSESLLDNEGSVLDVGTSALLLILDLDDLLLLVAPGQFILDSEEDLFVVSNSLLDSSIVNFEVSVNSNSLSDALPLEALVGAVDTSRSGADLLTVSLQAESLAAVGLVGSAFALSSSSYSGGSG